MRHEILDYLKSQRVGVVAIEMLEGSPHAATVHFAHTKNPFVFFFETCREYRKAEPLFGRESTRASFDSIYLGKFPEKIEKAKDPKFVCFKFIPMWWRFADWTTPQGKVIFTSE